LQKADARYGMLLLASALLAGACAGERATEGDPNMGKSATVSTREAPHTDISCAAEPIALSEVRPLVDKYCVACHSPSGAAGEDYDFRSDGSIMARRRNIAAKLRLHVMPPPSALQPSDSERKTLRCWAKG
jgi:uncharacterized membrane protein